MKVLVTGATGFIGKQLLLALKDQGHEIVVLTRDAKSAEVRLPVPCRIHPWQPAVAPPPPDVFDGVHAVAHLAGAGIAEGRWTAARKDEIARSRVVSTRHLVQAMQALERKPEVFVAASAVGYYGDSGDRTLDETSPPGTGFLADVCRQWESETFKAEALGIRTAALRIGVVLGKDGGAMKRMLPPFRLGLGGPLGNGRQWMSWVHVQDVAQLFLHAIENSSVKGAINAVSPNPVTNREFARTLGKTLHRPAIFPAPAFGLRLLLGEMADLLLTGQKASAATALENGYTFRYPTLQAALEEICRNP